MVEEERVVGGAKGGRGEKRAEERGRRTEDRRKNCRFVLRTPTLRAGSQFRIADCEFEIDEVLDALSVFPDT